MNKYYFDQLSRLQDSEFNKSIIISDGIGNKTNNLGLNLESIGEIITYLLNEQKKIIEQKSNEYLNLLSQKETK